MSNALRKQYADQLAEEERRRAKFWEREAKSAESVCRKQRAKCEIVMNKLIALRAEVAGWTNWTGEMLEWVRKHIERLDDAIAAAQEEIQRCESI